MKKTSILFLAASVLGIGAAFASPTTAEAHSVTAKNYTAEVSSDQATLYDDSGNKIDVALPANSTWAVGSVTNINGKDYYEVSTGAYLSSDDSYLYKKRPEVIKVASDHSVPIYNHNFEERDDLSVTPGSSWYSDSVITSQSGIPYVRISTDAYVSMYDVIEQKVTSSIL